MKLSNIGLLFVAAVLCVFAWAGPIIPPPADFSDTFSENVFGNSPSSNDSLGVQTGYAEVYSSGDRIPWPVDDMDEDLRRVVRYCYINDDSKNKLQILVEDAIDTWIDALEGPAGPKSMHSLAFREVTDAYGNAIVCYPHYVDELHVGGWNPQVNQDVVAIGWDPEYSDKYSSTVAYEAFGVEGRHWMRVHPTGPESLRHIVHEFGHILGLIGYQPALNRAKQAKVADAESRLCSDPAFAEKYKFGIAVNFIKADDHTFAGEKYGPIYDCQSIMHYGSAAGSANIDMCTNDPGYCALTRWKSNGNGGYELDWIPYYESPSRGDISFIRLWYPWKTKKGRST